MAYQDITDNFDYLMELPDPTNSKSYELNQIYVVTIL